MGVLDSITDAGKAVYDTWTKYTPAGKAVNYVGGKVTPKAPTPISETQAGKDASAFATSLVNQANGTPAPNVGTATNVGNAAGVEAAQKANQAAIENYNYQKQQQDQRTAAPRPTDPRGAAAYDASVAAGAKAVADAKARVDATATALTTAKNTIGSEFFSQGTQAQGTHAQGAGPVNATTISASPLNFATSLVQQAQQNQIGAQAPIQVTRVAEPTGVTAQQFSAPRIGAAPMVTAERIGDMRVEGVPEDISLDGTVGRNAQLEALGLYRSVLDGTAPSAAEQLQRKGVDESIGAAYGLAASLQGRNAGLALSTGVDAAGQAIARSAADTAALRAQEMETARAGLAALGSKISDQDFQVAATNQTKNLTVAITNLEAKLKTAIANQDAALRAGLGNQAAVVQTNIAQMQAELETLKANAQNSLTADIATMTAKLDASKANAANDLAARIQDSQAELTRQIANQKTLADAGRYDQADSLAASISEMQARLEADRSNQLALLDAAKATAQLFQQNNQFNAGQVQQNNQFNAGQVQQNNQFNAGQRTTIATGNADRDILAQRNALDLYKTITGNAIDATGISVGLTQKDLDRKQQYDQAQQQFWTSIIGTGGKALAL